MERNTWTDGHGPEAATWTDGHGPAV